MVRWLAALAGLSLAACAGPRVRPISAEPARAEAIGPLPVSCNGGREIVYSHRLPGEPARWQTITFHCTRDDVTAWAMVDNPYVHDSETDYAEQSLAGPFTIERDAFEKLWRAIFAHVRDHGCTRGHKGRDSTLTVRVVGESRDFTCVDLDARWSAIKAPLEAAVPIDPPASDEQVVWPFTPDYWKDELRYAGRRR